MAANSKHHTILLNPLKITAHLMQYRHLIGQLTRHEISSRYKGSVLGMGWSIIQPIVMLCVYTFVFSVVFKAKWGTIADESQAAFAMTLFMGMITFNLFGETVAQAPNLILSHANYVKKVVFPLEILPLVTFLSVLVNALFSLAVLLMGVLLTRHYIPWTALLLPLAWFPMMILSLGCTYFLASLGVFIRDMGNIVTVIVTILFFMSPIFYPLSAIPDEYQSVFKLNLIAVFVEDARRVVLWEQLPDWSLYLTGLTLSITIFMAGFAWFMKSKKAFADVI